MAILIEPAKTYIVAPLDLEVDCNPIVAFGDAVYVQYTNFVDQADASNPLRMPAIGLVSKKLTATKCFVRRYGSLSGFVGLQPGKTYWVSGDILGAFSTTPPSDPGSVAQTIGVATSTGSLDVDPEENPINI